MRDAFIQETNGLGRLLLALLAHIEADCQFGSPFAFCPADSFIDRRSYHRLVMR